MIGIIQAADVPCDCAAWAEPSRGLARKTLHASSRAVARHGAALRLWRRCEVLRLFLVAYILNEEYCVLLFARPRASPEIVA